MNRTNLKCLLAVFASDRKLRLKPGHLDAFVNTIDEGKAQCVESLLSDFEESVTGKLALRAQKKKAKSVARILQKERIARRASSCPRMTKKLIKECIEAGRDWAADADMDNQLHETDGQSEAMDIAVGLAPHPSLVECCADYVFEGICRVK